MAQRSETDAMALDRIYAACERRAITPHEARELVRITSEALRRSHQRDSLTLALFAPELAALRAESGVAQASPSAPLAPPATAPRVPWWRRWLRRMVG